jgi:polygalacturonase
MTLNSSRKIQTIALITAILAVSVVFTAGKKKSYEFAELYENLPFKMEKVRRPAIPSRTVSLTSYGAVGDGMTLNTEAFAKAISGLSAKGGGHLVVPEGIWLTGPITLLSGVDLHLEENAIIVFSADQDLYPIINTNFEGQDMRRCLSPVNALGQKNISITGKGIIDGSGDKWREVKKQNAPPKVWKDLLKSGGVLSDKQDVWFPDEGYKAARATSGNFNKPAESLDENYIKTFLRPVLVSIRECEGVLLEGVTFQNSPAWNIHPLFSRNIIIKDINVRNPYYATNGDGIDIDACENVILQGATFDVGDDAICIKSGKDEDGRRHGIPCRNLLIDRCTVYHGHGGFVVGSEMSGGVENIKVTRNCYLGTDVGLRFKSTRGRGGVVRNIWIDDIKMKDIIANAVIFNLFYAGKAATEAKGGTAAEEPVFKADITTPEFCGIHFKDIVCNGAASAIFINGLPEKPVRDLTFTDVVISADKGIEVNAACDIVFERVTVNTPGGDAPKVTGSERISFK